MGKPTSRRRALGVVLGAGAVALCGAALAPPLAFVIAPGRGKSDGRERWVRTVKLESLPEGLAQRVAIISDERDAWKLQRDMELGNVWLVRKGDTVHALSAACPHLGCSIAKQPEAAGYDCPCHESTFDGDGKREKGPSPRNMDVLAARVVDGFVEVDFRRFRQGTPDRVEIG